MNRVVWLVVCLKLLLHLGTSARGYGYFGDELYYLACANHPAFGYVDHPPFSIWLLSAWGALFGDSLAALRTLPALLGAAAVALAALLARELGGRTRAQVLCALIVALAPVNLVVQGYYSMNAVDIVVWEAAFLLVARTLRDPSPGRWLGLGCLLGIGLLNKVSVMWLGAGLLVGLLATPHRRVLRTAGPWLAGGLAALIFLPHVVWQIANGWPTLEFVEMATTRKMVPVGPLDLFLQQVLVWNPVALPVWLLGLVMLVRRRGAEPGRVFAIVFATTAAILIASGTSRPNYLALALPPLVAAGAIAVERASGSRRLRWLAPVAIAVIAAIGLAGAPLTLPILPVPALIEYAGAIDLGAPQMENREIGRLDPHFADMHGWAQIVDVVAGVYVGLSEADRARAAILTPSYGVAGAIDLLGVAHGLPSAISGHNAYWMWGPGDADASVVVIAGGPREAWTPHWAVVEEVDVWDCGYCLPGRNHSKVYIAREPRESLESLWPSLRHYH